MAKTEIELDEIATNIQVIEDSVQAITETCDELMFLSNVLREDEPIIDYVLLAKNNLTGAVALLQIAKKQLQAE